MPRDDTDTNLDAVGSDDAALGRGWRAPTAFLVFAAMLAVVPAFIETYSLSTLTLSLIYLVAAVNLNAAFGYAGQFVLHFPVVLGVGAYGAGVSSAVFEWSTLVSFAVGTCLATVVSVVLCLPGLKVRGFYLGIIGLFAVFTFPDFIGLLREWTGGEDGLAGMQVPELMGEPVDGRFWYWIMAAVFVLSVAWTYSLATSGWGLRVRAMRDAKYAGISAGLDERWTRLVIYTVCSVPVAFAGCVYAFERQFVVPDSFNIEVALLLLAGVLIGGKGTVLGPLVGTATLLVFQMYIGEFSLWSPIVYGAALLAGATIVPNGLVSLVGLGRQAWRRRDGRRKADGSKAGIEATTAAAVTDKQLQSVMGRPSESDAPASPILEISGVSKSFFGITVLKHVDLNLERGSIVGLVGPNGSGKSTLLNVVAGVLAADGGEVRLAGEVMRRLPQHKYAQLGIGRSFQVPQLIDECSARENVELGLLHQQRVGFLGDILRTPGSRRKARERRRRAGVIVELLGIAGEVRHRSAGEMPLGTKRVLEIGRAVALQPRVLLLDEPTAGLNPDERRAVGEFVLRIRDAGVTVLVVEHNVTFVLDFCDEVVLLDQGKIVSRGSTREPLSAALAAYLRYGVPDGALEETSDAAR